MPISLLLMNVLNMVSRPVFINILYIGEALLKSKRVLSHSGVFLSGLSTVTVDTFAGYYTINIFRLTDTSDYYFPGHIHTPIIKRSISPNVLVHKVHVKEVEIRLPGYSATEKSLEKATLEFKNRIEEIYRSKMHT